MNEQELAAALFNAGLMTREQIEAAAAERAPHKNFAQVIVQKGWVSPAQIAQFDPHALAAPVAPSAVDVFAFSQAPNSTTVPVSGPTIPETGAFSPVYQQHYAEQVNGTTVLVLGILGLVFCQILGPFAWVMGNKAIAAIDAGRANPSERTNANVGRILGIIGTVYLVIIMVFVLLVMLAAVTTTPNSNNFSTGASTTIVPPSP
jgi:hypothetical protein